MRSPIGRPTLAVTLLFALAGCAHVAPAADTAPRAEVVTGSRIAHPVDPVTGRATTDSPVDVFSAQELRSSGQVDLGRALRQLEPAIR